MCEHCGCRETPEIGKLGAEHDAIVDLADRVLAEVSAGTETIAGALSRLQELVVPHVRGEESGVFVVADEIGLGPQYTEDLTAEHRSFDAAFSNPDQLGLVQLEQLLDELYRHIAVEEYDLFPVVAKELKRRVAAIRASLADGR